MSPAEEAALRARVDTLEAALVAIKRYCVATREDVSCPAGINLIEAVCCLVTPPPAK
jgi:hypothetical protein